MTTKRVDWLWQNTHTWIEAVSLTPTWIDCRETRWVHSRDNEIWFTAQLRNKLLLIYGVKLPTCAGSILVLPIIQQQCCMETVLQGKPISHSIHHKWLWSDDVTYLSLFVFWLYFGDCIIFHAAHLSMMRWYRSLSSVIGGAEMSTLALTSIIMVKRNF